MKRIFLTISIFALLAGYYDISLCSVTVPTAARSASPFASQKNVFLYKKCFGPLPGKISCYELSNKAPAKVSKNKQSADIVTEKAGSGLLFAFCKIKHSNSALLNSAYPLPVSSPSKAMEIVKTAYGAQQQVTRNRGTSPTSVFDQLLTKEVASKELSSAHQQAADNVIEVGTITKHIPTVSELLLANDELKTTAWEILADSKNQDKNYRSIQPGTKIYFDQETGALSWSGRGNSHTVESEAVSIANSIDNANKAVESTQLGEINNTTPTVSHLLHGDPRYHDQTWSILSQKVNASKEFHNMATGSEVVLNPATMEISWNSSKQTATFVEQPNVAETTKAPLPTNAFINAYAATTDLSQAVQPYMGKSYNEVDCYELLVNGLKQLDIPYGGRNGLYARLTQMALDRGLPANAYLNGEGIVEVAGATVLTKNYAAHGNWKQDSTALVNEIKPLLNSGQILSFSTQTRGHTGIISRQQDEWTFINSGILDNAVDKHDVSRGVGEELLDEEIHNWFKLAHARGESLKVTLGELSQEKLRTIAAIGDTTDNRI